MNEETNNHDWQHRWVKHQNEQVRLVNELLAIKEAEQKAQFKAVLEKIRLEEMTDEERKGDSRERYAAQEYWNLAVHEINQKIDQEIQKL